MPTYRAGAQEPETLPTPHDPDAVLDYTVDWSAELSADSDTLVQASWSIEPVSAGLELGADNVVSSEAGNVTVPSPNIIDSATKSQAWLYADSAAGGTFRVENTVRSNLGRVFSMSFLLTVKQR